MKKFTGRYTTNTAKALKGSERILCQVSEDGTIYICNGFLLCTMNAPETQSPTKKRSRPQVASGAARRTPIISASPDPKPARPTAPRRRWCKSSRPPPGRALMGKPKTKIERSRHHASHQEHS